MEEFVFGEKEDVTNLLETIGKDYTELVQSGKEEQFWIDEERRMKNEYTGSQYEENLIKAFNAVVNAKNKVVKRDVLDKYDSIELHARENKLFQAFTDAANEHIWNMYQDQVSEKSVQDLFYEMEGMKGPDKRAMDYKKEPKAKKEKKPVATKIETPVSEKTVEKNKETIKKTARPREVISDV